MTRFEEVARLRELGKRLVALKKRRQDWNSVNYGIMEEISIEQSLHNAAPWLLEATACFQPGDAHILKGVLRYLTEDFENSEHSNAMVVFLLEEPDMRMRMVDVLVRALKAAEIMEGQE